MNTKTQRITIQDLLKISGLDTSKRIKLVRHAHEEYDITLDKVMGDVDKISGYQEKQDKPVFHDADFIVVFIGGEIIGTKAVFVGVYEVKGYQRVKEGDEFIYKLEEKPEFNHLRWRVVIEWGKATKRWYQGFHILKEVVEMKPEGRFHGPFPGYEDLILSFKELQHICNYEAAYQDWIAPLSAVGGVYAVYCKNEERGGLYVGSAYGEQGIWGRWKEYVKTKHGGNKELKELLREYPEAYKDFQFSILKIFSKKDKEEIKRLEGLYKDKLGTRRHGLNKN